MNAFLPADILMPKTDHMEKWAVIACDQFTSDQAYWDRVRKNAEGAVSTINLILPEAELGTEKEAEHTAEINATMKKYMEDGVFTVYPSSYVYVERTLENGSIREGLVGMVDLDAYDYTPGATSAIRATERTVPERIPPRQRVRRDAPIELPHVLMLCDDHDKKLIEPIAPKKDSLKKLYDFDLMKKGGHIAGYLIDKAMQEKIVAALEKLGDIDAFNGKYGLKETSPLVYAMGDGNHSLATAKEFYEEQKRENPDKDMSNALCRYALVEIVNLHSPALEFEAIHRIVTDVDTKALMSEMTAALELSEEKAEQAIVVCDNGEEKTLYIHKPTSKLTVGSLQNFLDSYIKEKGGKVDYIHGAEVIRELSAKENSIGFMLPDMGKEELFPTVIVDGALPRKTFSMGHAEDKRFYVEARKILK